MSRDTPQMRVLAARLIAYEADGNPLSTPNPPAVFHVCERLRPHLAALMGKGGFHAVLSRALAVTGAEVRWLRVVKVNADGVLAGWDQPEEGAEESKEAGAFLVAQLLGLLIAFIGDNLALRLVREVWPKVSLEDLNFTPGDHL